MGRFLFLLTEYGRWRELWYASCVAFEHLEDVRRLGHDVVAVRRPTGDVADKEG